MRKVFFASAKVCFCLLFFFQSAAPAAAQQGEETSPAGKHAELCGENSGATGAEKELCASVRAQLCGEVGELLADGGGADELKLFFPSPEEEARWLDEMSARLLRVLPADSVFHPDSVASPEGKALANEARRNFLAALHYNAARAGIDPQLVLAIIHVESAFRKYAISRVGARGYMQVMPFWVDNIGSNPNCGAVHNLFNLHTNLRYGTAIFRHYLEVEDGNLTRALARYNGSVGRVKYPNAVFDKLERYWTYQ